MGRGGALMLSSPESLCWCPAPGTSVMECISMWWDWKSHDGSAEDSVGNSLVHNSKGRLSVSVPQYRSDWILFYRNVRAISTARLNVSPRLHLRPIDVVVCDGPWRDLILESASCLDAFSTYPVQTLLPGGAPRRDNRYTGGLSSTVLSY